MSANLESQVGRVIRVGPGWADVMIDRNIRRFVLPAGKVIRVGSKVQVASHQIVAAASTGNRVR